MRSDVERGESPIGMDADDTDLISRIYDTALDP